MNRRIILSIVNLFALVSQVQAEDNVTINDFSISAGESKTVSIELESDVVYAGFQFDLYLPDGITIEEYSADKERIPESTSLSMMKQNDGSYRFIAAAMNQEEIKGTSGCIIVIKINADSELKSGRFTGYLRKVKLSKTDGTGATYQEIPFYITVGYSSNFGDANADKEVNTMDIVDIANHMMGKQTSTGKFDEDAADLNGDGIINAADIVLLVRLFLGGK